MNLGNKCRIYKLHNFVQEVMFYAILMLYLLIKLQTSVILRLSKFLWSNQFECCLAKNKED